MIFGRFIPLDVPSIIILSALFPAESDAITTEVIVNKADMHRIIFSFYSFYLDFSTILLLRLIPEINLFP